MQGKVWGSTQSLFSNDNFEVHRIQVKRGGVCSLHCHQFKHNIFYVETGALKISVHKNDYALVDDTILLAGDITDVKPNEYHTFEALDDTVAFEIYYSEPISGDIIRKSIGGMR